MQFTVLGSSGTYPTPGNPASSYLVRSGDTSIWCDAGPGSFQALAGLLDPNVLDAIIVSHRHPDHCVDVFTAFHALTYRPEPARNMPFFAPLSVIDHVIGFLDASTDHIVHSTFDFRPIESLSTFSIGDVNLEAIGMAHSVPTLGYRFEVGGRRLFYTADTGPQGTWIGRVGQVDLLVCEASLQGDGSAEAYGQHLTAAQAGDIGSRLQATRLLLTHIPPYLDPLTSVREAEATFGKTVMAAVPGETYEV